MASPAAIQALVLMLETHTTPSGQEVPLNSEENRSRLAATYLTHGDPSMTPVMCGFWLQAVALERNTPAFKEARTVAHRLHATYKPMEMHFAMASAMRIKLEQPELFRRAAN